MDKKPQITIDAIYNAWDFQWKIIGALLPSLEESQQEKVFKFSEIMSHSMPWREIFKLLENLKAIDDGFTKIVDSIEAIKLNASKMLEITKQIDAIANKIQEDSQKMAQILNEIDKKERIAEECVKLYAIGNKAYQYLAMTSKSVKEIYSRIDANSKEIPDEAQVDIPDMSKYDRNAAIDAILDYFHEGKITKEQMEARLSEIIAKKNVVRTINSFGIINIRPSQNKYNLPKS